MASTGSQRQFPAATAGRSAGGTAVPSAGASGPSAQAPVSTDTLLAELAEQELERLLAEERDALPEPAAAVEPAGKGPAHSAESDAVESARGQAPAAPTVAPEVAASAADTGPLAADTGPSGDVTPVAEVDAAGQAVDAAATVEPVAENKVEPVAENKVEPADGPADSTAASPVDAPVDATEQMLDALFEELKQQGDTASLADTAGNATAVATADATGGATVGVTGRDAGRDAGGATAGGTGGPSAGADSPSGGGHEETTVGGEDAAFQSALDALYAELTKPAGEGDTATTTGGEAAGTAGAATTAAQAAAGTPESAATAAETAVQSAAAGPPADGAAVAQQVTVSPDAAGSVGNTGGGVETVAVAVPLVLRSAGEVGAAESAAAGAPRQSLSPLESLSSRESLGPVYRGPPFVDAPEHWEPALNVLEALPDVGPSRWTWAVRVLELIDRPFAGISPETRDLLGKVAIVTLMNAVAVLLYVYLVRGGPY